MSEATHWYTRKGDPIYEIKGKNGKVRPTTLRDVRPGGPAEGAVPSVTMIANMLAKPGLEIWKQNQVFEAAENIIRQQGERFEDYKKRVMEESKRTSQEAAARGVEIHTWVENYYATGEIPMQPTWAERIIRGVTAAIGEGGHPEVSFASPAGYGGKIDLVRKNAYIDFKSKEFDEETPVTKLAWPDQALQLAAYRDGHGNIEAECMNVYISVTNPGLVVVHKWNEEELKKQLRIFLYLLEIWKLSNNYDPQFWPNDE